MFASLQSKGFALNVLLQTLGKYAIPPTVSNKNQRRLVLGFSIMNLYCVGPFILISKLIHHHLNDAS